MKERLYYIFISEHRSVKASEYRRAYADTLHYRTELCFLPLCEYKSEKRDYKPLSEIAEHYAEYQHIRYSDIRCRVDTRV